MARDFTNGFYNKKPWHTCRKAFISRRISIDGGMCQDCHERPGKIVHHIVPIDETNINDPYVTLNLSNLKYVCHRCHDLIEHAQGRALVADAIEYEFDAMGNPVPVMTGVKRYGKPETEEEY